MGDKGELGKKNLDFLGMILVLCNIIQILPQILNEDHPAEPGEAEAGRGRGFSAQNTFYRLRSVGVEKLKKTWRILKIQNVWLEVIKKQAILLEL